MSAERFFDDLARTLAEPMPRRRAVRVIGASLAAIAVPGISPRMARAETQSHSQRPICPASEICCTETDANGKVLQHNRCGFPRPRYQCVNYKCFDTCPPTNRALKFKQQATWSTEKYSDGTPKRYNCCQVPDTLPRNGECWPNCKKVFGPGFFQCEKNCCIDGVQRCYDGRCRPKCSPNTRACGGDCCEGDEHCCWDICCPPDKFCCGRGSGTCCDDGEFCVFKLRPGIKRADVIGQPQHTTCKDTCLPLNRCGRNCCGSGYTCRNGRCMLA